ncbi:GlsB/YeaQ/YmgE family stress response membrane protein [Cognatishimia sp. F0-27]|uniref:GlsB/YeaQ/YmgE family stress response membrane protein n=1 Tax=Cognatishimia sp. F0-27 TaxID=2816855 RepID=UPI001D0C950D|nr:GlsB/YeaQ/YmgE family stress response membrane protein [Cognatishimia sp. F0-27]MCC1491399.1 GlsB/YeaQ/YmgE family stress response membrane protein [Cognatishimia sp. F0-27]
MGSIIWLVIVGAGAGFIATRLMRLNLGIVETVVIGMAGALIGGLMLRFLLALTGAFAGLVGAILGAMALIWIWKMIVQR